MANTSIVSVKKNVVKTVFNRAWTDVEPKLITALASGALASAVISEAGVVGYPVPAGIASLITLGFTVIAGYIKSSTVKDTFEGSPKN